MIERFRDYIPSPSQQYEIVHASAGVVYNNMYVHYDDTGAVHSISNTIDPLYKQFEIDILIVQDFLAGGKRSPAKYKIDYFFDLSKGIIQDEDEEVITSNLPYIISTTNPYKTEITLEHDSINTQWIIYAREDVLDRVAISQPLQFFVCKKDDPHFLYNSFLVKPDDLLQGPVSVEFSSTTEQDLNLFSVITIRTFKSYKIKETE